MVTTMAAMLTPTLVPALRRDEVDVDVGLELPEPKMVGAVECSRPAEDSVGRVPALWPVLDAWPALDAVEVCGGKEPCGKSDRSDD
jgi:hypothetical protein